jgi:hypothetical protein
MAISIRTKQGVTIEGNNGKDQKFEYWIRATSGESDDTIKGAFFTFLPPTFNLVRYLSDYKITEQAQGIWIGEATYSLLTGNQPGQEDAAQVPVEFEIGGENVKLTQSLQTMDSFLSPFASTLPAVPNFSGGVNVTSNGIEGYEYEAPTLKWSETYFIPKELIYSGYLIILREIYGHTNDAIFRGFDIGEVYFAGASGRNSDKFADYYEINFKFVGGKNLVGFTPNGFGVTADKKAHDLFWVFYQESEDSASMKLIKLPISGYIERIRDSANFDVLQLPV